jgi:hypothetical protein
MSSNANADGPESLLSPADSQAVVQAFGRPASRAAHTGSAAVEQPGFLLTQSNTPLQAPRQCPLSTDVAGHLAAHDLDSQRSRFASKQLAGALAFPPVARATLPSSSTSSALGNKQLTASKAPTTDHTLRRPTLLIRNRRRF